MKILEEYTDAQVREIAKRPTPKPLAGEWRLIAPDGTVFAADSPTRCVTDEINARIPPLVALARIRAALMDDPA